MSPKFNDVVNRVKPEDKEKANRVIENSKKKTKGKTVYHFDPEKEGEMSEDELQFTEQFYQNAYKALKHVKNIDVSNIVLY